MTDELIGDARRQLRRQTEVDVHLAVFVFVIAGLALLNWIVSPRFWWVTIPAIGWGLVLAAHAASVLFEVRHRVRRT